MINGEVSDHASGEAGAGGLARHWAVLGERLRARSPAVWAAVLMLVETFLASVDLGLK
jgi:hypothetical protein